MKPRVKYDYGDTDLWGEPEGPPAEISRCEKCGGAITPDTKKMHARVCDDAVDTAADGA